MADKYGIYLSYNNQEEGFEIPVLPGEIEITNDGNSSKYEISGGGEINVIKSPSLAEYKFSSIFPVFDVPFANTDVVFEPTYYIDLILKWMQTKRPIRFVFTGMTFDINEAVSIESFEWKEVAGSPGLIEYDIELKQYKFYRAQKVVVKKSTSTTKTTTKKTTSRPNDKQTPKTYKLKPGDTLSKVAKSLLGDSSRWKEIQKLNGIKDSELKSLKVGRVLKIPS